MSLRWRLARAATARAATAADDRLHLAGIAREQSSHVFPKHHSFFWGELALYSFLVLVLSGTVLALHFVPATTEVVYDGSYVPLEGQHVSRAYDSALGLSFEVQGGLFVRQVHHWAALLFVASIVLHMCRNFFTGAFRKPRELTWLGGVVLLGLAIVEGYSGYSLVDDLLSGMGVRIMSGILLSVPVVGTWLHWAVFGSEFAGEEWLSRFFIAHVFLIPGLLMALIAVHLGLVWYQKHTQFPGPGAREDNVVGDRAAPGFGTRTVANGLCVVGVLAIMAGVLQINPVFLWGPFTPAAASTGAQPDWYALFLIGALRLFPRWEIALGPYTVPAPFWPALVLPLVLFALLAAYPFLERWRTGDRRSHQLLQRPRDAPGRTGLGVMALTFYLVLTVAGGDDILAITFDLSINGLRWAERIALLVLPPVAYLITSRICRGLQRRDRDALARGLRTGLLEERPEGVFVELRQPPGGVDHEGRPVPVAYDGARVAPEIATLPEDEAPR
ncbi:cytochrome bc complex cytochrome b subunit [Pseudonocardia sp. KRD-184]|uniref:Cytochrome bc complex cytochrome b subunit n=1 Tax=Pseudonocardia oceani TaxID=2792013 RepID=A0ABS6UGB9_9PSEU|nr:cytochrome bc complex cytochrome b subunit [Pseudonocardia oceani]MBW0094321.1 cytochrome bc complex cytochrome b subunit [Pseudonocardia oceani]MBW0100772.1 cytochrome bc complex cytochrome b subunit [Pseudonocardia oceani]MBW0108767.1 cytochrome bc complex cytochrome b subunit [Pseudonocardia oceani]MBW0122995.1 cytochrome bc complex cytochrome b subunit [Pseudonocardia oceani]MBW0131268.1 cytochrome bc complex cytochrome b subunit [Pseudonocardia oceani]